jgi:hypothetical protein
MIQENPDVTGLAVRVVAPEQGIITQGLCEYMQLESPYRVI